MRLLFAQVLWPLCATVLELSDINLDEREWFVHLNRTLIGIRIWKCWRGNVNEFFDKRCDTFTSLFLSAAQHHKS